MKMRLTATVAVLAILGLAAATFYTNEPVDEAVEGMSPSDPSETFVCHYPPGRHGTKGKLIVISLYDFPCPSADTSVADEDDDDGCVDYDYGAYQQEIDNHLDDHDGDWIAGPGVDCEENHGGDLDDDE